MSVSPLDSEIFGALLSDVETAAAFTDAAQIRAMLDVEAAVALAEADLGVIPAEAGPAIAEAAARLEVVPRALAGGTMSTGVPVPALVRALRGEVGGEAAAFVHWGPTSQDVVDTALVLRLRPVLDRLGARLVGLTDTLRRLSDAHRDTVMMARTRGQQATPTTFGFKVAGWREPLLHHHQRLQQLRPRLLVLSLAGASGTLAALGDKGRAVAAAVAERLDLAVPALPWHTRRDNMAELAGWLSMLTGSLGKIGGDLMLLAQSEVAEVRPGAGGGSSTMPQKANPIAAEMLVALAEFNAVLVGGMHRAMRHDHERGGVGWTLEWLTLPQMVVAAATALNHAQAIFDSLTVDAARMRANLDASRGLVLAEAAMFALAAHMPRPEAEAVVKEAVKAATAAGRDLIEVLAETVDAPVDWTAVADPLNYTGIAGPTG